jgi:hypothetical protein
LSPLTSGNAAPPQAASIDARSEAAGGPDVADLDKQIAQVDGAVAVATQRGKAAAGLSAVDGQHRLGARSSMANFAHGAVLQSTGDRPDRRGAGADGKIVRVSPKNTRRFLLHVIL